MNGGRFTIAAAVALLFTALLAAPAHAAKQCGEPGAQWQRATPAEAGMDGAKLQDAMDYGTSQLGFAVRVYRNGCLVGEDRGAPVNRNLQFESWSMAKSVVSLMFGRAMTMGLISPDDLVGALVPEADAAHGRLTMLQLLTQTSGLEWNGLRDYNIFTQTDRVGDALTLPPSTPPASYFEYAQSPVALLAQAISAAAGEDPQEFLQKQLFDPIGIPADAWHWNRNQAGHIQGFYGVQCDPQLRAMGELYGRDGVWNGNRLLSHRLHRPRDDRLRDQRLLRLAIWTDDEEPCILFTADGDRPRRGRHARVPRPARRPLQLLALFGQLVRVMPSQGMSSSAAARTRASCSPAAPTGRAELLPPRVLASLDDDDRVLDARRRAEGPARGADKRQRGLSRVCAPAPGPVPPGSDSQIRYRRRDPAAPPRRRSSRSPAVGFHAAARSPSRSPTCPPRPARAAAPAAPASDGAAGRLGYELNKGTTSVLRFTLKRSADEDAIKTPVSWTSRGGRAEPRPGRLDGVLDRVPHSRSRLRSVSCGGGYFWQGSAFAIGEGRLDKIALWLTTNIGPRLVAYAAGTRAAIRARAQGIEITG